VSETPNAQGFIQTSSEIKRLWKGATPTARDLLREMKYPRQISREADTYYIARKLLLLSPDTAVMIQVASSKPPDFQPLEVKKSKRKTLSKGKKRDSVSRLQKDG
jgi:hypothetical protein